jgi:hypothetical protein
LGDLVLESLITNSTWFRITAAAIVDPLMALLIGSSGADQCSGGGLPRSAKTPG